MQCGFCGDTARFAPPPKEDWIPSFWWKEKDCNEWEEVNITICPDCVKAEKVIFDEEYNDFYFPNENLTHEEMHMLLKVGLEPKPVPNPPELGGEG